jgi:predicted transcriptional regulator
MSNPVRFSDSLTIRCDPELMAQAERAARARGQKPTEWWRQAGRTVLQQQGIASGIEASREGTLSDRNHEGNSK